ncbi:MAG: hypothetical protein C4307_05265 [Chloroflexota bacterium]
MGDGRSLPQEAVDLAPVGHVGEQVQEVAGIGRAEPATNADGEGTLALCRRVDEGEETGEIAGARVLVGSERRLLVYAGRDAPGPEGRGGSRRT